MKRGEFIKKILYGSAAIVVAPTIITSLIEDDKLLEGQDTGGIFEAIKRNGIEVFPIEGSHLWYSKEEADHRKAFEKEKEMQMFRI